MKKVILGLLVAVFASVGIVTASASAAPATTDVTGVVTKHQMAVPGATVTVLCGGSTQTDTTDGQGSYLVTFTTAQCPFGSTVKVTAQKGGESGVTSGTVRGVTTKLNIAIVNVEIPEYGIVGAVFAGTAGIGLIAFKRRQHQF